jgi:hypothetical protein
MMGRTKLWLAGMAAAWCGAAPAQPYVDAAAKAACECVEKSASTTSAALGICVIKPLLPFEQEVKRDFGINLQNPTQADSERLGRILGMRMVGYCPEKLTKAVDSQSNAEATVEGTVTRIDKEGFVVFSVNDNSGKTTKLYWMTQVNAGMDLVNGYESLLGKTIKASYLTRSFFDPRISDYRPLNILVKIW